MAEKTYIAVDLGASNGRVVIGRLDGDRLEIEEVHRFPNRPVNVRGEMYWDLLYLYSSMLEGLEAAARSCDGRADGIGCVSWGADYGFLDEAGRLTGHVYCYRDARTRGMLGALAKEVSFDELFARTGSPFDEMATLCQLFAAKRRDPQGPRGAAVLLFVCDLMHYFLCGRKVAEYTMATQSQLFNVGENRWDRELCELVGTLDVMPEVVPPATILAQLDERIAERCGFISPPPVIATATHDTAAAAFAAPITGDDCAFVSSGTWQLICFKTARPVIGPEVRAMGMGNYGGADGNIFVRVAAGLWLIQQCRAAWSAAGGDYTFGQLVGLAEDAPPHRSVIYPSDARFDNPDDMPQAIRDFCRKTGQDQPDTPGQIARCIFESLALECQWTLQRMAALAKRPLRALHVIGGGSRNDLLNQMIADATGLPVVAGPEEATAIGNALLQAKATGALKHVADAATIVRNSFDLREFTPRDDPPWLDARRRFTRFVE